MPHPPARRRIFACALGLTIVLGALTGCSQALEEIALGGSPRPTITAGPTARNDLSAGPVLKQSPVGDAVLTVRYSSILPAERWTAAQEKPLNIEATAGVAEDAQRLIYLSLLHVEYRVLSRSVVLPAPAPFTDRLEQSPGFSLLAPVGYRQTLMLPPLQDSADTVELTLTYVVIVQAGPGLARYLRQAVTDHLTIAIVR